MADELTVCFSDKCPIRKNCLRYTSKATKNQKYVDFDCSDENDYFIDGDE